MAEIHEHDIHHEYGANSMGFVMGIILLIVAIFLMVYFLLPAVRGGETSFNIPSAPTFNMNPR